MEMEGVPFPCLSSAVKGVLLPGRLSLNRAHTFDPPLSGTSKFDFLAMFLAMGPRGNKLPPDPKVLSCSDSPHTHGAPQTLFPSLVP